MTFPSRPIAFVLAASNHGPMIVNRNDYLRIEDGRTIGMGAQLFGRSGYDEDEVRFVLTLLSHRRRHFGDGVVAIDGGANIGVHTVEWARQMHGWGSVISFEAQEPLYYALCGNVALNNCFNARLYFAALGGACGDLLVPRPDYFKPSSFGSLELRERPGVEFIGQKVSYAPGDCTRVPMINLDSLALDRLDFLKLDVEGMEVEVLHAGRSMIGRHRPVMFIEILKSDAQALAAFCHEMGYRTFPGGANMLAIHGEDPVLAHARVADGNLILDP